MGGCVRQGQSLVVDLSVLGLQMDLMILGVFSNLNNSMITFFSGIPAMFGKEMLRHPLSSFSMSLEKYGIPDMVTT